MLPSGLFPLLGHANLVALNTGVAFTSESRDQAEVAPKTAGPQKPQPDLMVHQSVEAHLDFDYQLIVCHFQLVESIS